jgi:C1A family cysteine protease
VPRQAAAAPVVPAPVVPAHRSFVNRPSRASRPNRANANAPPAPVQPIASIGVSSLSVPQKRKYNLKVERMHPSKLRVRKFGAVKLPPSVDLRPSMPPIFDQGDLGSCTANALCSVMGHLKPKFVGSRLFLYYNERKLENDVMDDSGANLSTGIKALQTMGVCPEADCPYVVSNFTHKPSTKSYTDGLQHRALSVLNVQDTLAGLKTCLAAGNPFVVGIQVYDSFESDAVAQTGMVPMPNVNTESLLGGHAVCVAGYNDATSRFLVANSWGTSWGIQGYFWIPYAYLTSPTLASDTWTIMTSM